jgi:hypothetical protein
MQKNCLLKGLKRKNERGVEKKMYLILCDKGIVSKETYPFALKK